MLFLSSQTYIPNRNAMLANQHIFGRFVSATKGQNGLGAMDCWQAWALDNGAFSGFNEARFMRRIEMLLPHKDRCLFVAVPDVPFDWPATLRQYEQWHGRIRNMGLPRAIVLQNGAQVNDVPWNDCEAVFVGGDTAWKRGHWRVSQSEEIPLFSGLPVKVRQETDVFSLVAEAKRRGKHVHYGRQANAPQQLWDAYRWGADSVDGTSEIYAPDREFKWISATMWAIHNQSKIKQNWSK